jgi:WD40 repeat protein
LDKTLRVWDLDKQEDDDGFVRVLTGHTSCVTSVTQLADGKIVSGSGDGRLRVWGYVNPETGEAS